MAAVTETVLPNDERDSAMGVQVTEGARTIVPTVTMREATGIVALAGDKANSSRGPIVKIPETMGGTISISDVTDPRAMVAVAGGAINPC